MSQHYVSTIVLEGNFIHLFEFIHSGLGFSCVNWIHVNFIIIRFLNLAICTFVIRVEH